MCAGPVVKGYIARRRENRDSIHYPPIYLTQTKTENTMKAPFEYNHPAAVDLCCQYSESPETLRTLIERINIEVGSPTVVPSPWRGDRQLNALHMLVTVNGYTFPYYGSHNDAKAFTGDFTLSRMRDRKRFYNDLLYSLLCCIGFEYSAALGDMEDMGMNPDSIKDVAKWNEIKEHARKLRSALRLTSEEWASLPS
jgi:hypothetical protein